MTERSEHFLAVAERFMAALHVPDVEAVRAIYAPNARIWHNFDGKLQTVDENIKSLLWMHRVLGDVRYEIRRREALPDGFLQQHILRGTTNSGESFAMHACAICRVEEGRIVELEEYLDLGQTAPLTAATGGEHQ